MKRVLLLALSVLAVCSCAGNKNNTQNIELHSEADLAGLRVAAPAGTSYELGLSSRNDIDLQTFNSESDVLQALINGKVDVIVNDEVVYNSVIRKDNGIKIAMLGEETFPTGFMFRKEDRDLAQAMDAVQQRMVVDGSMQSLKEFWLTDVYAEVGEYVHIPDESTGKPLRVATCSMSAPLAFQVNGDWYGLEIDILRQLGNALNRPLEIKAYEPASGILAVKTGQADVLCGCIFITPERKQEFIFSEPYHYYRPAYFVVDNEATFDHDGSLLAWMKNSIRRNLIAEGRWKYITNGLLKTIKITLLSILFGSLMGAIIYNMSRSRRKWMRSFAHIYNNFIDGIPDLVLLLIMFYVVFAGTGISSDAVAIISFAMFFAASACGIYRSSLDAVPPGQMQAGLALGFTRTQSFMHIVLPQALRHGLPLFKAQCITLLKGTAIVGYIAIQDLTRAGDMIRSRTFDALIPLLVVTVLYFLLAWLLGLLLNLASSKIKVL